MRSVIYGIAEIFWATVWADCAEQAGKSLSGVEITDDMPPIPQDAYNEAWRLLGKVEALNGVHIAVLVDRAIEADTKHTKYSKSEKLPKGIAPDGEDPVLDAYAQRFGNCLAYEAMGHGVSWTDDHAAFELKVPHIEAPWDLEEHAWEALKAEGFERPEGE